MTDKLYTIGEFAAINKISPRMLRHYNKIGLLNPTDVSENGYRLYSSSQITTAAQIKKYRACEFSLEEISRLLENKGELPSLAKHKIQELKGLEHTYATALSQLYEICGTDEALPFNNPYEISLTVKNSQLLCLASFCREEEIETEFENLYDFLHTAGLGAAGVSTLLCDLSLENGCRPAVPVNNKLTSEKYSFSHEVRQPEGHTLSECPQGYTFKDCEPGQYLSTFHYGDYCEIAAAYDKLLIYMEQNSLSGDRVFMERYFLDSSHTIRPSEYITEISAKITP